MIKVIETKYKGYFFRSRLEARWAVFFDFLGIEWEYEKEGFDLGEGLRYLPDFWLPDIGLRTTKGGGLWVEVKGDEDISDRDSRKIHKFSEQQEFGIALLIGPVDNGFDQHHEVRAGCWDEGMAWMKCRDCNRVKFENSNYYKCESCGGSYCSNDHPSLEKAVEAARSARFSTEKD